MVLKALIHWLLVHQIFIGPVFSQSHQPMSPGADGPPISYAPIVGSRSGATIPDGVVINWRMKW